LTISELNANVISGSFGFYQVKKNTLHEFFNKFQVFRLEDLNEFIKAKEPEKVIDPDTRNNLLAHYIKQGRLVRIRREVYQTIPPGESSENYAIDPYLLTSKLAADAVLSHHTALEASAKAYSIFNTFYYWTKKEIRYPFEYQGLKFKSVQQPKILLEKKQENFGIKLVYRKEQALKVTTFERTFVDVLDRPKLTGSWEEIWRSLASIDYFDIDEIFHYCSLLENATIFAKVGFYLEQNQKRLAVTDKELDKFSKFKPQSPHYLERQSTRNKSGKLFQRWNLIVPDEILEETWNENL
jgi:predicted transcriptional regulator of viral defense system